MDTAFVGLQRSMVMDTAFVGKWQRSMVMDTACVGLQRSMVMDTAFVGKWQRPMVMDTAFVGKCKSYCNQPSLFYLNVRMQLLQFYCDSIYLTFFLRETAAVA